MEKVNPGKLDIKVKEMTEKRGMVRNNTIKNKEWNHIGRNIGCDEEVEVYRRYTAI